MPKASAATKLTQIKYGEYEMPLIPTQLERKHCPMHGYCASGNVLGRKKILLH